MAKGAKLAKQFGRWKVLGELGGGGQGQTFRVVEIKDGIENKEVFVLKLLKHPAQIVRFENEIRACSKLSHPNVLKIIDHVLEGSNPYLVSEYCAGGSLNEINVSDYSVIDRLRLFRAISGGVAYAHRNKPQIVHRDLKPSNIFLRDDRKTPVVGDFGICFIDEDGSRITLTHEAVGARRYTAPELEDGRAEDISPAADVYSLGKLLYWLMAGSVFDREKHREPRFDLTKNESDPALHWVYELLDKMIQENPSERFHDAYILSEAVENVIKKILMNAHPLDLAAPQACLYCGAGFYKKFLQTDHNDSASTERLNNSGFRFSPFQKWLILVCDNCGNSQVFIRNFPAKNNWKTD
jgi:serine/threonine protein kinase